MDKKMQNKVLVIPKEKATFWMDGRGRWHNRHGPFENKKIIDYFNAAIEWDADGYYVIQQRDGITEKVYFSFEDTALFVIDVIHEPNILLVLNTRRRMPLSSEMLFIYRDQLYVSDAGARIKFNERALFKMADKILFEKGGYLFSNAGHSHRIPSEPIDLSATEARTHDG